MKILISLMLVLSSCTFHDICQKEIRLKAINEKISKQVSVIKSIDNSSDNVDELFLQQSILEDLLVEKAFIELQNCN